MHDFIFVVVFIALIASPAMVATFGGRKEYNPGPEARLPRSAGAIKTRLSSPPPRNPSVPKIVRSASPAFSLDSATLPMHNSRGMANR